MFQMTCPTCRSDLMIKNDELIGQVLPCPKCGSLVKICAPDESPTPPLRSVNKPTALRRFPDVLISETPSGVIGHMSSVTKVAAVDAGGEVSARPQEDIDVPEQNDAAPVSGYEKELKSRRYTAGILFAVLVILTGLYLCIKLFGF